MNKGSEKDFKELSIGSVFNDDPEYDQTYKNLGRLIQTPVWNRG
jgi:hypothetical protein